MSGSCVLRQEVTCMVNVGAIGIQPDRVRVAFDDERAVADAGVVLPAALRRGWASRRWSIRPSVWAIRGRDAERKRDAQP